MANSPVVDRCIFCGSTEKKTREHIWGDWLKGYVRHDLQKHGFLLHDIDRPGQPARVSQRIRAGDPLNSKVKVVCGPCNNGWLSGLQSAAKPALIPLVQGSPTVLGLDAQAKLASWVTMAAMTSEYLTYNPRQITATPAQRATFMNTGQPPEGWRIWLGFWEPNKLVQQWVHASLAIYETEQLPNVVHYDGSPQTNTMTMTVRLGKLLFHVMGATDPRNIAPWDWRDDPRARRLLVPLWPTRHSLIAWPVNGMFDRDAYRIARSFMKRVDAIGAMLGY